MEKIGEKIVFTQNRYPQEMLVDGGGETRLLELIKYLEKNFHFQTWHSTRDCVVPYSSDDGKQSKDTDPGSSCLKSTAWGQHFPHFISPTHPIESS